MFESMACARIAMITQVNFILAVIEFEVWCGGFHLLSEKFCRFQGMPQGNR